MARYTAHGRYYLTLDRSRVVREGDPAAAMLYITPGRDVDADEAKRLGLLDLDRPAKAAAPEPEPEAAAEAPTTKAVHDAPEDKAHPAPQSQRRH